jgi:hypothetical protein
MNFKLNEKTLAVLKNFAQINSQLCIESTKIEVVNSTYSVIGSYTFDEPLPITKEIGIYDINDLLAILSVYKQPTITENTKNIVISGDSSKTTIWTHVKDMMPKVLIQQKYTPTDIKERLDQMGCELEFVLPAEKFNVLMKLSSLLKAEWMFFETAEGKIRITVGNALESSDNISEVLIDVDIKSNSLTGAMKCSMAELRLMPSDYSVKISSKGMTHWTNAIGVEYFIGCTVI